MVQSVTKEMIHSHVKREPFCYRNINNASDEYIKYVTDDSTAEKIQNTADLSIEITSTERVNILSTFFYAFGISRIIRRHYADIFGTKKVCGVAVLVNVIVNILTPFFSQSCCSLIFTLRFIAGFSQGMCYPAITFIESQWITPDELTRVVGFIFQANSLMSTLTLMLSGHIISLLGLEYVFYISGSIFSLCLVLWIFFWFDTLKVHPRISGQVKHCIIEALRKRNSKKMTDNVLWLKMLQSLPIWSASVAYAGSMCGLSLLVTQLPLRISSIMGVNSRKNGILLSLPFICEFVGSIASSWLLYFIMYKCHWWMKKLIRVSSTIALAGLGVSLLLVGYFGCRKWSVIFIFTLGEVLKGFPTSGNLRRNTDIITSNVSGTALGISTYAFLNSIIIPVVIDVRNPGETISEWRIVFWLLYTSYIGTALFYKIFVSTELQPCPYKNKQADENPEEVEEKLKNWT
ncbi:UNVERIFIED_CONTAM: hypothetical protein RMT77_006083 [Armadillidium vulgare]